MKKIQINISASPRANYPIIIQANALMSLQQWIPSHIHQVVVITDHHVRKYYGKTVKELLKKSYKTLLLSFTPGETSKTSSTKTTLEEKMLSHYCGKDTCIIALGGGVVGDVAGFIAATYMRGIPYLHLPTTFLSMIDSSIGGKTGIDTVYGKNLIGAFWQPHAVIVDTTCLNTLPKKHILNGLIEALKIFLIYDLGSVYYFKDNWNKEFMNDKKKLMWVIQRAIHFKARIVEKDVKENHQRLTLNFGHTIGHALEKLSCYQLLHGFAVAYGMLLEIKIAQIMGYLSVKHYHIIRTLLLEMGFSAKKLRDFNIQHIIQITHLDKKVREGHVNYVLLKEIGKVYQKNQIYTHPVPDKIVKKAFLELIEEP